MNNQILTNDNNDIIKVRCYGFDSNNSDSDIDLFFEHFDKLTSINEEEKQFAIDTLKHLEREMEVSKKTLDMIDNYCNKEQL